MGPRGGVVTQRSAKPFTPVQFWSWPPTKSITYEDNFKRRFSRQYFVGQRGSTKWQTKAFLEEAAQVENGHSISGKRPSRLNHRRLSLIVPKPQTTTASIGRLFLFRKVGTAPSSWAPAISAYCFRGEVYGFNSIPPECCGMPGSGRSGSEFGGCGCLAFDC